MKAFLLATAMLATPLIAQMTPPADPAPPPAQSMPPADTTMPTPAPAEPMSTPAPADPMTTTTTDTTTSTTAPAPMEAPAPATTSATPVFQQPPTVEQAFPAPPPKANYPWCSRTVTDSCKQRYDPK